MIFDLADSRQQFFLQLMPLDCAHRDQGVQGLHHGGLNPVDNRLTQSIRASRGDKDIRQSRDCRQIGFAGETEFIAHGAKCFQVSANNRPIELVDRTRQMHKVNRDIDSPSRNHRLDIFLQWNFERSEVQWGAPVNIQISVVDRPKVDSHIECFSTRRPLPIASHTLEHRLSEDQFSVACFQFSDFSGGFQSLLKTENWLLATSSSANCNSYSLR